MRMPAGAPFWKRFIVGRPAKATSVRGLTVAAAVTWTAPKGLVCLRYRLAKLLSARFLSRTASRVVTLTLVSFFSSELQKHYSPNNDNYYGSKNALTLRPARHGSDG